MAQSRTHFEESLSVNGPRFFNLLIVRVLDALDQFYFTEDELEINAALKSD